MSEESMTLADWMRGIDAHMLMTSAARWMAGRFSIGSRCGLRYMARELAPLMEARTAGTVARDLAACYGPPCTPESVPADSAERELLDACRARLAELGDPEWAWMMLENWRGGDGDAD